MQLAAQNALWMSFSFFKFRQLCVEQWYGSERVVKRISCHVFTRLKSVCQACTVFRYSLLAGFLRPPIFKQDEISPFIVELGSGVMQKCSRDANSFPLRENLKRSSPVKDTGMWIKMSAEQKLACMGGYLAYRHVAQR